MNHNFKQQQQRCDVNETGNHGLLSVPVLSVAEVNGTSPKSLMSRGNFLVCAMALLAFLSFGNNAYAQLNWSGDIYLNNEENVTQNITLTGNVDIYVFSGFATISGEISGASSYTITKRGEGQLILTGGNLYTGNTVINAGTLILGGSTGSIAGNIVTNSGTYLAFSRTSPYTYNGDISGAGHVYQYGPSSITLGGGNTYAGNTYIQAPLILSASGSITSSTIIVENYANAKLDITAGNKTIYQLGTDGSNNENGGEIVLGTSTLSINDGGFCSAIISGTGGITLTGSSTLCLWGNNTYTGNTNINNTMGMLYIGYFTATGAIAGNIVNNGNVFFGRTTDYTYNGVISGPGNVWIECSGTITLTGNHTATGNLNCSYTALVLAGNWAGNFIKNAGSTLTVIGNRSIGGTLTMNGGTTNMDLGGANPSRISATGALTASGTNMLNITDIGTASSYILISAASGVTTTPFTITVAGTLSATSTTLTFTSGSGFVPVTDIINVPTTTIAGGALLTLTGTVVPTNATNQAIIWNVEDPGTTGAYIVNGNQLYTSTVGTVVVRATILNGTAPGTDFIKDFNIVASLAFVPVTDIINVPTTATVGTPLTLTGTVVPSDATNQTIAWTVQSQGGTGATITGGNIFNATTAGTAIVRATIVNGTAPGTPFTKDFYIVVSLPFVPVTDIINVPTTATATLPLTLTGTVVPSNATNQTIAWSVYNQGGTGATITGGNILNTTNSGTAVVRATIANGTAPGTPFTKDFNIVVSKAVLGGNVTVTGNTVFGQTLTANTSGLTSSPTIPNLGVLSYQWQRGTTNISGATASTYTLVQADIGNTIRVVVSAANCSGSVTSASTASVTKASQAAPPAPTLLSSTSNSITLNTVTGCEYRRDGGAWQSSTVFTGLTPSTSYSFTQRYAETATHFASPESPAATFSTSATEFTPVIDIIDVPTTAMAYVPLTLSATVVPADATNKTITWTVENPGTTGAYITGVNTFNATTEGTATVRATIVNGTAPGSPGVDFVKDFDIVVLPFIPVIDIIDVPTTATAGIPLTLTGTVVPANATNKTITWTLENPGSTQATITNSNIFNAIAAGTATVRATIANGTLPGSPGVDFVKDFDIVVTNEKTFYKIISSVNNPDFGTITPYGETTVEEGDDLSFIITPNTDYEIDQVLIDNVNDPAAVSAGAYTFTNVTEDHTIHVIFRDGVGIVETLRATSLQVYPNPTTGLLTVTYYRHCGLDPQSPENDEIAGQARNDIQNVEIFDVMGRSVLVETRHAPSLQSQIAHRTSQIEINISHLPTGVYFIRITTETGVVMKKIIKN